MQLQISNVTKAYPNGVKALNRISLTIDPGMYGLLGPNGAGKSTLMRTLATLQNPDHGQIQLGELDVLTQKEELRQVLGYLPQDFGLLPNESAQDLLNYMAVLKGVTKKSIRMEIVEDLLLKTNLWEKRKHKVGGFSGGMRQRFGVAVALVGNPKLLIVDEPTAGLDPEERVRFLNLLSELGEQSIVLLSTHIVDDVAELCTKMAIIKKGDILMECQPLKAVQDLSGKIWSKVIQKENLPKAQLNHKVISKKLVSGQTMIHVYSDTCPGNGFDKVTPHLEDVYFSTMAGHLRNIYNL